MRLTGDGSRALIFISRKAAKGTVQIQCAAKICRPLTQGDAGAVFLCRYACDGTVELDVGLQCSRHCICHALRPAAHKLHRPACTAKYGKRAKDVNGESVSTE